MGRLVIEFEASREDEKIIADKISLAAMKVLRSNRGNILSVRRGVEPLPAGVYDPKPLQIMDFSK